MGAGPSDVSLVEAPKEYARKWSEKNAGAKQNLLGGEPPEAMDCESSSSAASTCSYFDPPRSIVEPTIGATITPRRT